MLERDIPAGQAALERMRGVMKTCALCHDLNVDFWDHPFCWICHDHSCSNCCNHQYEYSKDIREVQSKGDASELLYDIQEESIIGSD